MTMNNVIVDIDEVAPSTRSWKPEVIADGTGKWYSNSLRFATKDEAFRSARDLSYRWLAVRDFRAAQSEDPVNYMYSETGDLKALTK